MWSLALKLPLAKDKHRTMSAQSPADLDDYQQQEGIESRIDNLVLGSIFQVRFDRNFDSQQLKF
jgi:hypothetical protein